MRETEQEQEKPVVWVGSSLEDLKEFPAEVQDEMGYALYMAQIGDKHPKAKPLEPVLKSKLISESFHFTGKYPQNQLISPLK